MRWPLHYLYLIAALAAIAVPTDLLAQSLFGGNSYSNHSADMMIARIVMMAISIGSGFCLGWFLSPQAAELRRVVLSFAAVAVIALAMFNNGILGWGAAWTVSLVGFCAALGYWAGQGIKAMLEIPTTFGTSRWASLEEMEEQDLFGRDGIILGSVFDESIDGAAEKVFSYKGDRHLLTCAPTRSGKGISHVITNLLNHEGSVLVIDPKGENAMITADAREAMGQEVHRVEPWHISDGKASRFNPLDWVINGGIDAAENAMLLADALIQEKNHGDPFWSDESKGLLQGLILHVSFDEAYEGKRNLGTMRDLLLLGSDDMTELFQRMSSSPHPLIASCGSRSLQKEPKLIANVLASAQAETHMLDSERLRECLSASDFDFEDLKKKPMSIYLILPVDRLKAFGRFLRLLVQQAITINARNIKDKPKIPVLFILDEMPALGRLTMIEEGYGLMAGYGIQLWGITQDLGQLRKVYGEDYESFIGNAGVVAYFGSPDKTSAEYFSGMCGVTTVWNLSSAVATAFSSNSGGSGGSSSNSTTHTDNRAATQRKLAYPDELRRMDFREQLIVIDGQNPIRARKLFWFEDPEMSAKGVNLHTS